MPATILVTPHSAFLVRQDSRLRFMLTRADRDYPIDISTGYPPEVFLSYIHDSGQALNALLYLGGSNVPESIRGAIRAKFTEAFQTVSYQEPAK